MDDDIPEVQNSTLVPCFFRDLETFQVLQNVILPALIARAEQTDKTLRLWSIGCPTGENAYSLAILLADLLGDALSTWNIRIFATDLDEVALNSARLGMYDRNCMCNIPQEDCTHWFEQVNQQYRISSILRKIVITAQHDITHDAPFARIDLIMCHTALDTYPIERQHELVHMFAFSLAPRQGYLVMGRSTSIKLPSLSFQHIADTAQIYQSTSEVFSRKTATNNNSASLMKQLLHYKGLTPPGGLTTPPPLSLQEVLFRLAPTGIIVIDRAYRIITANRAAHRLCSLPEQAHLQDFLHSIPGLPYASVRTAIDTVFYEGNTQNLLEVELTLTQGGNGRVLSIQICLLPAEVATPDYVVMYIQEVTEYVIIKQTQRNQLEAFQNLQLNYTTLTQKHTLLLEAHTQLQNTSAEILSLYEQLQDAFEEYQTTNEVLEEDLAALQEELKTVNHTFSFNETP